MKRLTPDEANANFDAWMASKAPKTEHQLQVAVVNYCRSIVGRAMVKERFAAIPNGAFLAGNPQRRAGQSNKLKAEGMRPGMPDMVFWRNAGEVLWMELKNGKEGRLSDNQKEVHASLLACGFTVCVVRTLEDAKAAINQFYQS